MARPSFIFIIAFLIGCGNFAAAAAKLHFPIYDGNGNVTTVIDENVNVVAEYEYSPFGETIRAKGAEADNITFRFSTKPCDEVSGLYYYGYRHYSPELGRWLSRDPKCEEILDWRIKGTKGYGKQFPWF